MSRYVIGDTDCLCDTEKRAIEIVTMACDDKWVTINGRHVLIKGDEMDNGSPRKPYKKVGKVLVFKSDSEFDEWVEQAQEEGKDITLQPVCIDDGWKLSLDAQFECKNWETAVKRFAKVFSKLKNEDVDGWIEGIKESCEMGFFSDRVNYLSYPHDTPEEIMEAKEAIRRGGHYSWSVENIDDNRWYIFFKL